MNIPKVEEGSGNWYLPVFTESRSAKIEIPFTINETYEYSFVIPKEFSIVNPENKVDITNSLGSVYIEFIKNKDGLTIIRKININKNIIDLDEYESFKELLKAWKNKNYKQLILKK